MELPLTGIRILESAHQYPGPYCSMLLADLGAEVIKIERPGLGDLARQAPLFFNSINGNKKSLTLDLQSEIAREILYRLVKTSDVFMEGFRPGVAGRLGVDYPALKKIHPGLIYCSISGYGQDGPYSHLPGHDLNYLAMAGMLNCFRDDDGRFILPGVAIGDLSAGMFAAIGILAALQARQKSGEGRYIDVSMFDGLVSWMTTRMGIYWGTGNFEREQDAGYGVFRARDGGHFSLAIAHEDWFWQRLCVAIGFDDYADLKHAQRMKRRSELLKKLQDIFLTKDRDAWLEIFRQADVPYAPVKTPAEIENDPHVLFRKMVQDVQNPDGTSSKQVGFPVKMTDMEREVRTEPPGLGEQTYEILTSLGYSDADVDLLKKQKIV